MTLVKIEKLTFAQDFEVELSNFETIVCSKFKADVQSSLQHQLEAEDWSKYR